MSVDFPPRRRPTIADVAAAAQVSIATVNRVLSGRHAVRKATAKQVVEAAEALGFYAARAIRSRVEAEAPKRIFGFLMQQQGRSLYQMLGRELKAATIASKAIRGEAIVEHREDLSAEATAERLLELGREVDAIAIVAADHPKVTEAIDRLSANNVPVVAVISDLTAPTRAGYVGLDNWKVGATAGWAMAKLCRKPGKVGIFVGNHRYLCQDMCEIRFRSYFRERAPEFRLLDSITTFEDSKYAYQSTLDLLHHAPDLVGLFIAGGGKSGVLRALREDSSGMAKNLTVVGLDLTPEARSALVDGVVQLILSHPIKTLAEATVDLMSEATSGRQTAEIIQRILPFEIYTQENLS
jgi:LacI family transcriptional regulator